MHTQLAANLYNPHEQTKEQLIEGFVVRCKLFEQLFQEIKTADMSYPQQHFLIEGQRGSGKTTLLLRLSYEVENDLELHSRLIPIVFKEESYYGITRLFQLWERVAQELEGREKVFKGLHERMSQAYADHNDYERTCFKMLLDALVDAGDKKLLLLIDNLGEMFQNFSDQESHRLREILMTCPHLRVIGATSVVLEAFFKYEHAFYEFFKTKRLEGLNREETRTILMQMAKSYGKEHTIETIMKQQPGRIESLRIMTGGVIRTIVLLFEIFIDHENGSAISDLDLVLDRVTPLYKHRMDDLKPLQREIVNAIALSWDAISPEELAHNVRRSEEEVTSIISQLEEVFIIQRIATQTDINLYCLQERFFNIWYLMRLAPKGSQQKVIWLVRFLEGWYSPPELLQRAKAHLQAMAAGTYHPKAAYYLTEALSRTSKLDMETEDELIQATRKYLQATAKEFAADLSPSDKEMFEKGETYYQNDEYAKAIEQFLQMKNKNEETHFRLGYAFEQIEKYGDAVKYYEQAVEQEDADAMNNLGFLYENKYKDMSKAEQYYLMAVAHKNASAMNNLGILHQAEYKNLAKAKQYYLMAIKNGNVSAMNNLGWLYHFKIKDMRKAKQYYLMAVEKGQVDAMNNLGRLYENEFNDAVKAEQYYLMAIEHGDIHAIFNLGLLYDNKLKDIIKAKQYYLMAVEHQRTDAMFNLALLYENEYLDLIRAEQYYIMSAMNDDVDAMFSLGRLYHYKIKDVTKAEQYYLMAAEKEHKSGFNNLAWMLCEQKTRKEDALKFILQSIEQVGENIYNRYNLSWIYLWHNRIDEALELANIILVDQEMIENFPVQYSNFIMLLLAKEQCLYVKKYFADPQLNLQERFKPLYYALLYFTNDPGYRKMPPELAEPVEDIIKQVKQMAEDYQ